MYKKEGEHCWAKLNGRWEGAKFLTWSTSTRTEAGSDVETVAVVEFNKSGRVGEVWLEDFRFKTDEHGNLP